MNLVRCVYLPAPATETDQTVMRTLIDRLDAIGVPYEVYAREESLTVLQTEILLSSPAYLERSIQPIFYLTLRQGGKMLAYFTKAIEESALLTAASEIAEDAEYLMFGSDGPRRREIYRIPTEQTVSVLTFGDENLTYLSPISRRALEEKGAPLTWVHDEKITDVWSPRQRNGERKP